MIVYKKTIIKKKPLLLFSLPWQTLSAFPTRRNEIISLSISE